MVGFIEEVICQINLTISGLFAELSGEWLPICQIYLANTGLFAI